MRSLPGVGEPGPTVDERIAQHIAQTAQRRESTRALRALMNERRTYGLRLRHAAREHRQGRDWRPLQTATPTGGHPMPQTFGQWLTNQAHRQDPIGDLARDYLAPCPDGHCDHGQAQTVEAVREDLDDHAAIPAAYDALDRAAVEWAAQSAIDQT